MNLIHFETLGCKLNQIETESIAYAFISEGFLIDMTPLKSEAFMKSEAFHKPHVSYSFDTAQHSKTPFLCIINTCTVTGKAEQKARRLIRLLLSSYPHATVLVTGCYAELEGDFLASIDTRIVVLSGTKKDILALLPAFLKTQSYKSDTLPAVLHSFFKTVPAISHVAYESPNRELEIERFTLKTDSFFAHSRASLKIQDGCNNACSYCRIRLARGTAISLDSSEVIARVTELEERDWHEVILTGVNVSQYISSYEGKTVRLPELLALILTHTHHIAIRISSLYPERVDETLCEVLRDERIRPHFHLSIQSGSDRILKAMNRPYDSQTVYKAVERLRSVKENPFIACDIIAGFPDEQDEDFALTLEMCRELRFAWIHAFPFSPRPGTKAFTMKPQIPQRIAGERVRLLTTLAQAHKKEYEHSWLGRAVQAIAETALFDTAPKTDSNPLATPQIHTAVTENYIRIAVNTQHYPSAVVRGSPFTVTLSEDMLL